MTINFTEVAAYLEVESQKAKNNPEQVEYWLPRKSGRLILSIWEVRSLVSISILDGDGTEVFSALIETSSVSVKRETPSKLQPHVEVRSLTGSLFHISGALLYDCAAFA